MVYETDGCLATIDGDAAYNIGRIVPVLNVLQRIAVNNREILYVKPVDSINVANHFVVGLLDSMLLGIGRAL